MSEFVIEWRGLGKAFEKDNAAVQAIQDIDLQIREGEFVSIVGPSGCGKSTLLNMTAGIMKPTQGEVLYRGTRVERVNTKVGYITQKDNLLPWRTVRGNAMVPLEIHKIPKAERERRFREQVKMVGLEGFEDHLPSELSGGMRKRAVLIRTFIYGPETLLMDEPFGALDAQLKVVMHEELLRMWSGTGKTIVFVTHDLAEAVALSDRVIVLSKRPGVVRMATDIPLARPRNILDLGLDPEAATLTRRLWEGLREDVRAGEEI
jgi:NitT/TauT family transport system ATP-binding protein